MTKKKKKTNQQCIKDIMTYSNHGALAEIFVLEAIRRYAEAVSKKDFPAEGQQQGFTDWTNWKALGEEIHKKIEEHLSL